MSKKHGPPRGYRSIKQAQRRGYLFAGTIAKTKAFFQGAGPQTRAAGWSMPYNDGVAGNVWEGGSVIWATGPQGELDPPPVDGEGLKENQSKALRRSKHRFDAGKALPKMKCPRCKGRGKLMNCDRGGGGKKEAQRPSFRRRVV